MKKLTDEQRAIVHHAGSHALVSAVPGSGKTTVLVARLRRLVADGNDPRKMLSVMYNKAAQLAFSARVTRAVGSISQPPSVRTFHSIGLAMNRRLQECGALPAARLVTSGRAMEREARKVLAKEWQNYHKTDARPQPEQLRSFIEYITLVKSNTCSPEQVFEDAGYEPWCRPFPAAFARFEREREAERRMYYDDMIYRPMQHLANEPSAWELFADRYDEILIDEIQDISPIQFAMMKGIAGRHSYVMGVGDPDQSIYSWRGSSVDVMMAGFEKTFAPCARLPMTRTFRFGHELALFANHLIACNRKRDDHLVVAAEANPRTRISRVGLEPRQPTGVVERLEPLRANGALHRALMLGRNFGHCVPFEIELTQAEIPFFVLGREPLIFLPEIAAMVAALSIAAGYWSVGEDDRPHFIKAFLSTPTMYVRAEALEEMTDAMQGVLDQGGSGADMAQPLYRASGIVGRENRRLAANLSERAAVIGFLASGSLAGQPPAVVAEAYMKMTGFRAALEKQAATKEQGQEAVATLDSFVQMAAKSGTLREFLDVLGPMAAHDRLKPPDGDHLTITSIHRAKGLEADLVMVAGMGSGMFPNAMSGNPEEERRLGFVAVTRAIQELVLFHPLDETLRRMCNDTDYTPQDDAPRNASRYLYEGEPGLSRAVADVIESGRLTTIKARRDDIVPRYLRELGCANVSVTVDPKHRAATTGNALSLPRDPLATNFKPALGQSLFHPDHGECRTAELVHHPIYMMEAQDGTRFHAVLDPTSGWSLS